MRRVLIVDDHTLVASTLTGALRYRGYDARPCAPRTDEHVLEAVRLFTPDVVLLDLELAADRTSLPLIAPLREAGTSIVMLTATTGAVSLAECVEAGATGILSKEAGIDDVVRTIELVIEAGSALSESERQALLDELQDHRRMQRARQGAFEQLTRREQEVLAALTQGKTAQAIADETFTSVRTVRGHIQSVLDKLGVSSQLAAVAKAAEVQWTRDRANR